MNELEHRIWRRVAAAPEQANPAPQLHQMALESSNALRDYRALIRGGGGACLRPLEQWERANLESLRGLFRLLTGRQLHLENSARCKAGTEELYLRALEQLRGYTAASAQPKVGVVFGALERRQAKICDALVRFMGAQGGKRSG